MVGSQTHTHTKSNEVVRSKRNLRVNRPEEGKWGGGGWKNGKDSKGTGEGGILNSGTHTEVRT